MSQHLDWADSKHEPLTFDEVIGNVWAVNKLREFGHTGNFTNLIFSGPPGCGKSCCAKILGKEVNAEMRTWDASDDRGLPWVRKEVKPFAVTRSIDKPFKIVFADECEKVTPDAQDALRKVMVQYSSNCKFILATNNLASIENYITSRCTPIRFGRLSDDEVYKIIHRVAGKEQVLAKITEEQLYAIASSCYGDARRAIKVLQTLCEGGKVVTKEDVEMVLPTADVDKIGSMLTFAFNGEFTEAVRLLDEILYKNMPQAIYEVIEKEFLASKFAEGQKAVIAAALGSLPPGYALGERKHMYGFIANIYMHRGERY
jgi:replication factor C small subunit